MELDVSASVPERATFWVPEEDDISEEGFGAFRGTWPIIGVDLSEATQVMEAERLALEYVDANSATAEEFESLAKQLEDYSPEDPDEDPPQFVLISPDWYGLESLELGVAGLVFALSARGLYPAASCRSHYYERASWADCPVVLFAGDRDQIQHLQPLAAASGCGFDIDPSRPELLVLYAPSVLELMALASAILNEDGFPDSSLGTHQ